MRLLPVCMLLLAAFCERAVNADEKPKIQDLTPLPGAIVKTLEGTWEIEVATKKGWKGTIRAYIEVNPADSPAPHFGNIRYDGKLSNGDQRASFKNAPPGGIYFAGVKQGEQLTLVGWEQNQPIATKLKPADNLTAPFGIVDDNLTLNLSKCFKRFCPPVVEDRGIDLDWEKLVFVKIKNK